MTATPTIRELERERDHALTELLHGVERSTYSVTRILDTDHGVIVVLHGSWPEDALAALGGHMREWLQLSPDMPDRVLFVRGTVDTVYIDYRTRP